jgi:hypothetical protein
MFRLGLFGGRCTWFSCLARRVGELLPFWTHSCVWQAQRANQVHYMPTAGQSDCSNYRVCSNIAGIKKSYSKVDTVIFQNHDDRETQRIPGISRNISLSLFIGVTTWMCHVAEIMRYNWSFAVSWKTFSFLVSISGGKGKRRDVWPKQQCISRAIQVKPICGDNVLSL